MPVAAGGDRRGLPGSTGEDRRGPGQGSRASPSARRPRPRSSPRAPTTVPLRRRRIGRTPRPGAYVPTAAPAVPQWSQRKPWLMTSAAQFRPGPPPALTSDAWARDYNEVKALGGKASTRRSARADRHRPLLGVLAAADLLRGGALGGARSRAREVAQQRPPVRGGGAGDGRRDDRGLRRQVPLQLLAPGHRDPQRRHRRQ